LFHKCPPCTFHESKPASTRQHTESTKQTKQTNMKILSYSTNGFLCYRRNAKSRLGTKSTVQSWLKPYYRSTIFHPSFQAHVTTENTIHRLGAWLRLNKQTILASVKHRAQRMGQNPPSTAGRSNRAAPTHRTSASLPRYRQLTIHAALEQSILNQRNAQDPVLAAALQLEDRDDTSTSASSTSTDTQSSYHSSSAESSEDDDSCD
jgi:hypothetical protein